MILDTDMTTRGGLTPEGAAIASPHPKWPNELPSGSHGPFQPTPVDLVKGRVIRADTGKPVTTFRFALRGRTVFDLLHPNPQDSNPSADTEIYLQEVNHADGVFEAKAWSSGRHTPYIRARGLAEESIVFSVLQKEAFFHRGIYDSISMLHAS